MKSEREFGISESVRYIYSLLPNYEIELNSNRVGISIPLKIH